MQHARHVKAQAVAQLQFQGFGNAVFDAQTIQLLSLPRTRNDRVVLRLIGAERHVEFAVHQTLGTLFGVAVGGDGVAIDRHQACANHGVPIGLAHACVVQGLQKRLGLIGLNVDDKTVGRIHRRGIAPAADEVSAQQHQQGQGQQAHRQRAHLHHGVDRTCADLSRGQHQPRRRTALHHAAAQHLHGQPGHARKQQHGARKATHHHETEFQITADCDQQHGKTGEPQGPHAERGGFEFTHIAAHHAQRRHAGQLQHRRQTKRQQQSEARAQAIHHRPHAGRRQGGVHQTFEQSHKHQVHGIAQGQTQGAGKGADPHKFGGVRQGNVALTQAQHAQHGAVVQMACGKGASRECHGHRAEQRRKQSHQVQELARTVQGLAHLGAACFERLHTHTAHFWFFALGFGPR